MNDREKRAQLYEQYKDTDVKRLSDEELDRQIVEMGRVNDYHAPDNPVYDLLEARKEERWTRKQREMNEIIKRGRESGDWSELLRTVDVDWLTSELMTLAKDVYDDALDTAESRKEILEYEMTGDRAFVEAQIYPSDFNLKANKYNDDDDGLLDVLMDAEQMMETFCPITFEVSADRVIDPPTFEEALSPGGNRFSPLQDRDNMLAALFAAQYGKTPLAKLPFPLQRLYLAHNVPLQDIGAISYFDSTLTTWFSA